MPSPTVHHLAVACLLCVMSACSSPSDDLHAARIQFDSTSAELGRLTPGESAQAVFTFQNAGGRPLIVDRVRAACGLDASLESDAAIAPGDSGRLSVSLRAPQAFADQTQTVTVYTNDPQQPVTTLKLHSIIDTDIAASPPQLYLGSMRPGQDAPLPVALLSRRGTVARKVDSQGKLLTASLTMSGDRQQVHVRIRPDAPAGRFNESITVHTNSVRSPQLAIAVSGTVEGGGS